MRARVGEVVDLAGDEPQALAVGVADHRGDEALEVEVDRDRQVDVVVDDQRVVADARVDLRELVHGVAERARDERQVGEREALGRLPLGLVRGAHAFDALEVDLDRRVHVRARRQRLHHVLGGAPADVVERDDLVARDRGRAGAGSRRRGRRGRGRGRGAGAGAGDGAGAAAGAGAGGRRRRAARARSGRGRGGGAAGSRVGGVEHVLAGDAPARAAALDGRRRRGRARRPGGARSAT